MTAFSACYFCGGTVDVEMSVIPGADELVADRVALCPSCRDKLSTIVSAIVDQLPRPAPDEAPSKPNTNDPVDSKPGGGEEANDDESDDEHPISGPTIPGPSGTEPIPIDIAPETVNRVVRLLQNREFPVHAPDFIDIAANAYELDPVEVEAVLDLAVEREMLIRSGSTLNRPPKSNDTDT